MVSPPDSAFVIGPSQQDRSGVVDGPSVGIVCDDGCSIIKDDSGVLERVDADELFCLVVGEEELGKFLNGDRPFVELPGPKAD